MKIKYTEIKCPKCKREWQHRGTLLYAQCPNCKKTFKKEQEIDKLAGSKLVEVKE